MSRGIVLTLVIIAALGAGWFFLSPLFIDEEVNEALPGFERLPSRADVDAMSEAERERLSDSMVTFAQSAPDQVMTEDMPSAPQRLAAGTFRDADSAHRGEGEAAIYTLADGSKIARFEDFRVTNGPALIVLLAKAESPQTAAEVIDGGYVSLGDLKGNVGSQNYTLPDNIDPADYGSIVIWCELFDVLFSAADLAAIN